MIRVSKSGLLGIILSLLSPLLSFFYIFSNIKRKNANYMILGLSISVFTIVCFIPPYQDLYRRYLETYLAYNYNTSYMSAIDGHVDVMMYLISLFMKKNDIPFYFFPAIQAGFVTYLFLSVVNDVLDVAYEGNDNRTLYLIAFAFINIIAGALGLRFYLAIALVTKGISILFFKNKKISAIILFIISVLFHFSMAIVLLAVIVSYFVKINKKYTPMLFIAGYLTSSIVLLYVVDSGILGFIGQYIRAGYIDYSGNVEVDTKGNALVVLIWKYVVFLLLYIPCYIHRDDVYRDDRVNKFLNFINIFFIMASLTSLSANAFNRYLIGVGSFFMLMNFFLVIRKKKNMLTVFNLFFIILFLINFLFQNIYLQRRPILLGDMWKGLYTPLFIATTRTDDDFKLILNEIDNDGDWVKDKLAIK